MYKITVAGHPLHPQLVVVPAGLLPFSAVMDAMHLATGERKYGDAARLAMVGGILGGLAAGAAGAVDYRSIPRETPVKKTANLHMLLNVSMLGLFGLNLLSRNERSGPSVVGTVMSVIGATGLVISAWYGGKLSYDQGVRVRGVDPLAAAHDLAPPGDEALKEAFEQLEDRLAPARLPAIIEGEGLPPAIPVAS